MESLKKSQKFQENEKFYIFLNKFFAGKVLLMSSSIYLYFLFFCVRGLGFQKRGIALLLAAAMLDID